MSDVVERLRELLAKAGDITIEWGSHYPWDANILFDGRPVAGVEADAIRDEEGDVEQLTLAPATETIMEAMLFLPSLLDEITRLRAREDSLSSECDHWMSEANRLRLQVASLTAAVEGERERYARVADEHYAEIGRAAEHHHREGNEDSLGRCHARMRSASQIAAAIREGG